MNELSKEDMHLLIFALWHLLECQEANKFIKDKQPYRDIRDKLQSQVYGTVEDTLT